MIPYGRQSVSEEDVSAVIEVLRGDWLTQGPTIERFERAVSDYVGAEHAVAFSSGTAALHGAAWAAGLGPGDQVHVPALTFIATANAAKYVGASPQLVDLNPGTWNMDVSLIPDTSNAAIPVHYAGLPVDLAPANWNTKPAVVIEDAAHALGALSPEGPVGNCANSDMVCFSFHPVKPITSGEGGMVTTNNSELAERLRRFRSHGIVRKPEHGEWFYEVEDVGFHYRMTDIQAALGHSQMSRLDNFISRRNEIAAMYRRELQALPVQLPPMPPEGFRHGYHLFPILVPNRARVFSILREAGIGVQVHYVPLHHHPTMKNAQQFPPGLPITDQVYQGLISLPIHPGLSEDDQAMVVRKLAEALDA